MLSPIQKFHPVDDHLATGAQPRPEDFAWLREQGFSTVVNLNIPSARNFLPNEGDLVAANGMQYIGHPVDCSKLSPELYEAFRDRLAKSAQGKVFVHCAANVKSTALVHAYRVRELKHDRQQALDDTTKVAELEPKWFDWFARLGV